MRIWSPPTLAWAASTAIHASVAATPSQVWMEVYRVDPLELAIDYDLDGVANELEGEFYTDPRDPRSKPSLALEMSDGVRLGFEAPPNTRWIVEDSGDLRDWRSSPGRYAVTPDGKMSFTLADSSGIEERYFRLRSGFIPDRDGDGLNDAEEALLGSNPFAADTDGDGSEDAEEFAVSAQAVVDGLPPDALFVTGSYPAHLAVGQDLSRVQLVFNRELTPGDVVARAPTVTYVGPWE